MMDAVSTSETSVNFYDGTRFNILEGCHLRENLKSHRARLCLYGTAAANGPIFQPLADE
jgi:hypothetical protein